MTIPLLKLKPVKQEDKYSNVELNYSGYGASAAVCSAPLMYDKLYHKSTTIKDYSCTSDRLPFVQFPGWDDPLAYSPVCRNWFIDSVKRPNQSFYTEAYPFAGEPIMGFTLCAPFFKESYNKETAYGTTCVDISPQGDLNEYFQLESASLD